MMDSVEIMEHNRVGLLASGQMPLFSILTAFLQAGHSIMAEMGFMLGGITLSAQSLHHLQEELEEPPASCEA
jgi:hypothetical protein